MRFKLPRLIGITGKAGAGKDTLADYLVRQHGYHKYSLAKPLKDILNARFGWTDKDWLDRHWKEADGIVTSRGTHGLIALSPRMLAQWLGTEVGRFIAGPDVWANMMAREWWELNDTNSQTFGELPRMVVPDVRFNNEAQRILALGGAVIRVVRTDAQTVTPHTSETGVADNLVSVQVVNDKDITSYLREAIYALEDYPHVLK